MIMQAGNRTTGLAITARSNGGRLDVAPAKGTPESRAAEQLISRLLAAAEESVATTSYSAARRRILQKLEQRGPLTLAELPGSWPVTPWHLAHLVHELEQDGLVESLRQERAPARFRLTSSGVKALATTRTVQLDLITRLLRAAAAEDEERTALAFNRLQTALDSRPTAP
jgi:DNA-binding MarR family transcriptional regulator